MPRVAFLHRIVCLVWCTCLFLFRPFHHLNVPTHPSSHHPMSHLPIDPFECIDLRVLPPHHPHFIITQRHNLHRHISHPFMYASFLLRLCMTACNQMIICAIKLSGLSKWIRSDRHLGWPGLTIMSRHRALHHYPLTPSQLSVYVFSFQLFPQTLPPTASLEDDTSGHTVPGAYWNLIPIDSTESISHRDTTECSSTALQPPF